MKRTPLRPARRTRDGDHLRVLTEVRDALRPVWKRVSILTSTGWRVLGAAVAIFLVGGWAGWSELRYGAVALGALVAASVLLALGGSAPQLAVSLTPARLTAGRTSRGVLQARNPGTRTMRSAVIELPVGAGVASFTVPRLAPGAEHEIAFEVPTVRRGVIAVGPVTTVRADPFGLVRRVVSWSGVVDLFVHPALTNLPSLDAGLVRDLEGRSTSDPSASDLDFHTLREYAPGDERRHIHWLSSARASAARGTTTLLTKGYTDTRRSHLGVVVDGRPASYADVGRSGPVDEAGFEAGITAAASVAVRALRDEMDVTVVAADEAIDRMGIARTLDGFAKVSPTAADLPALCARLSSLAPSSSIVLVVTGENSSFPELRRAAAQFPPSVRFVALRIRLGERTQTASVQGISLLSLGDADDLPRLIGAAAL